MKQLTNYLRRELFLIPMLKDELVIFTDKRKLIQIILTIVDFIRIYNKQLDEDQNIVEDLIKCKIKLKNIQYLEIKFFLQHLEVPQEVADVLSKPWAGSRINSTRWGAKEFFEIVQEMMKNKT